MGNIKLEDVKEKLDKYFANVTPEQLDKDLKEAGLGFYTDQTPRAEVTLDCGVSFAVVLWRNEDELPEEMTDEDYRYIFDGSKVDMVRLFPYVVIDGKEHFLRIKN